MKKQTNKKQDMQRIGYSISFKANPKIFTIEVAETLRQILEMTCNEVGGIEDLRAFLVIDGGKADKRKPI